jgi:hypothetical protein
MHWTLGLKCGNGFVFDNETDAHVVAVPEFEIDSQVVTWAQYAEFVEDGGYDDARWWSTAGWQWVQRTGRRVPRYVDQLRQGVLQRRFGVLVAPMHQPVVTSAGTRQMPGCRATIADRGRMGNRRMRGAALGRCLGVDRKHLHNTRFRSILFEALVRNALVLRGIVSDQRSHASSQIRNFYRPERDDSLRLSQLLALTPQVGCFATGRLAIGHHGSTARGDSAAAAVGAVGQMDSMIERRRLAQRAFATCRANCAAVSPEVVLPSQRHELEVVGAATSMPKAHRRFAGHHHRGRLVRGWCSRSHGSAPAMCAAGSSSERRVCRCRAVDGEADRRSRAGCGCSMLARSDHQTWLRCAKPIGLWRPGFGIGR